jgi:hypothetical protein
MTLLEKAWEEREQYIYKTLFGDIGDGIYVLSFDLFKNQFGCENVDPRWLHYGVFKSPPNGSRKTWIYVSSGMSNPWEAEEKEEYSGLGTELILETENDESWAIPLVQSLVAFNILLSAGKYGDKPLLEHWSRIPQPIEPNITHLVLGLPLYHPETIELCSGKVDLLQVVGITKAEFDYAKEFGSPAICNLLTEHGVYPVTNPNRESIT